jgi:excisionase family DNA binding protein
MDLTEAAAYLRMTKRAVRGRVSRRQLPYRKLGRRLMFLRSELERFVTELSGCSYAEALKNVERSEM